MFGSGPARRTPLRSYFSHRAPLPPSSRKTRSRNPLGSSCCLAPERWGRASSARTRNSQPLASSLQVPTWLSQKHYGPEATTYGVVPNRHIRRAILREGGRPVSCCGFSFGHFLLAIWERKMKTAGENSQPFGWGSAVTALSRDVWIWPSQSPAKATLARP